MSANTKTKKPRIQDDPNFRYVYHERIGMLCEDREPTPLERTMAFADAKEYCLGLLK